MGGKQVEEIVIPWDRNRSYSKAVSGGLVSPVKLAKGAGIAVLFCWLLLLVFVTNPAVPGWARVADVVVLMPGVVVLGVVGYRKLLAYPKYADEIAVSRLLLACPEYEGAYGCYPGACDELKWTVAKKDKDPDGKPITLAVYPPVEFVVELDTVRRILAWKPDPAFAHLTPPTLGQELRLRFDTSKPGMDAGKLATGAPTLASKLGLNDYQSSVDLTRGETRHVDVRIAKFPEGDIYTRFGRK